MPRSVKEIMEQAKTLAAKFENFEIDPAVSDGAEALAALHRAALRRAEVEAEIAAAVEQARESQVSWDAIGRRLGTTGEAARQRYGQRAHH